MKFRDTPALLHALALAVLWTAAGHASAQTAPAASHDHAAHGAAATDTKAEGEVRKIDTAQGKITLRHGPIANLDMPGMTMVFTAADPKLLAGLTEGDQVRFSAEKRNGVYMVTGIEAAR